MLIRKASLLLFIFLLNIPLAQNISEFKGERCPAGVVANCNKKFQKFTKTKLAKSLIKSFDVVDKNTIWLQGRPSIFQMSKGVKHSFFTSAWYDFLVPIGKAITPFKFFKVNGIANRKINIQLDDDLARGPVQTIFDKMWKKPLYKPTANELVTLHKYNKYDKFIKIQNKLKANPKQLRVSRFIKSVKYWATFASFFIGINYAVQNYQGGMVGIEKFATEQQFELGKNQVQILIDDVPFPHLGIRIGESVYSYGQTHMTKREMAIYFDNEKYVDMLKEMYPEQFKVQGKRAGDSEGIIDYLGYQSGRSLNATKNILGLDKLPKTLTAINLNLSPEEYIQLKNYLEGHRAYRYKNQTGINDCASMIAKALKKTTSFKFNQLIDASPGQMGYALSLMKSTGDKRVGKVYQVSMDNKSNNLKLLSRNTYVHMLESKLFISYFFFNQSIRSFMETYFSPEEFVSLDPEIRNLWEVEWKKEFENHYEKDQRIGYLYELGELIAGEHAEMDSSKLRAYEAVVQNTFSTIFKELEQGKLIDSYDQKKNVFKKESLCSEYSKLSDYLVKEYQIKLSDSCSF